MKIGLPMFLKGIVQHYAWGASGSGSLVRKLADLDVPESEPCAELWLGTHVRGSAEIIAPEHCKGSLRAMVQELPELLLGSYCAHEFGPQLPFMLKVLSISTALSIQAHPDVALARNLHTAHPDKYPDANHKPEVAVALTEFELLFGFRPKSEIKAVLQGLSELVQVVPSTLWHNLLSAEDDSRFGSYLQALLDLLLKLSDDQVKLVCSSLEQRFRGKSKLENSRDSHEDLFLRLSAGYPDGEVGLLVLFLMNFLVLSPGEAIFVGANVPHAYISGDIIECLANSDNVVRGGLTQKFKDATTLVEMLDYRPEIPQLLSPLEDKNGVTLYQTPAPEFDIRRYSTGKHTLAPALGPRILLVVEGAGHLILSDREKYQISSGSSFFLPANMKESLSLAIDEGMVFEAFVPVTDTESATQIKESLA